MPEDASEAAKIAEGTLFGGKDVIDMPRYFKPWEQGLPRLWTQLSRVDDIKYLSKNEKQSLRALMAARGLRSDETNALIMWGGSRRLVAIFDRNTQRLRVLLTPG